MDLFSTLSNFIILFGVLLFIGLFLIYYFQNSLIYMPVIMGSGIEKSSAKNPTGYRNPGEKNLDYEDVNIRTEDELTLHGWFIKQNELHFNEASTIVFFHENAGNIGTRLDYLHHYSLLTKCNILIIAYRGYSDSQGAPSESGIQLDSKAVLKYIFEERKDIKKSKIFIHGRSLGGAVAIYAATHTNFNIAGIILENTFTSIGDMADIMFSRISFMKKYIQRNFWPSIDLIGQIKYPILFIMALKDEIVPPVQMLRLYEKANQARLKEKYVIEDGMHNTSWADDMESYFLSINRFIQKCLQAQG